MTQRNGAIDFTLDGSVQIAGVSHVDEANMLIECGADLIGFPLNPPVHKEDLAEADVARIIRATALRRCAVVITYLDNASDVCELCERVGATIVQLHGRIDGAEVERIRALGPALRIIKAIVIGEDGSPGFKTQIDSMTDLVDAFITDTFDPVTGARGATGKTHDWRQSRAIVEYSSRPVMLAGGLTPGNVRRAIREVRPSGVDVHSGVEDATGKKTRDLVQAFVSEALEGFAGVL